MYIYSYANYPEGSNNFNEILIEQGLIQKTTENNNQNIYIVPNEPKQLLHQLEQVFLNDGKSDKELINLLITGYKQALLINYDITIIQLKKLIQIKQKNKNFYYIKDDERDYFSEYDKSVHCKKMDTNTIFHETGHALHYFLTYNKVPNNFNEIIELAKQNEGLFSKIEIFDLYFREIEQKELKKLKETSNENIKNYFLKLKKEIENIMNSTRENVIASYINLGIPKEHVEKLFNGIINTEKYIECLKNIYYEEIVGENIYNMISDFYYKYILGIKNEKRKGTRR